MLLFYVINLFYLIFFSVYSIFTNSFNAFAFLSMSMVCIVVCPHYISDISSQN
jgi:hypothetical protein